MKPHVVHRTAGTSFARPVLVRSVAAVSIIGFVVLLAATLARSPYIEQLNSWGVRIASAIRAPWLDSVMVWLTETASPLMFILASLAIYLIFVIKGRPGYSLFMLVAVGGAALSGWAVKSATGIARPISSLIIEDGYSFPSMHATLSAAFFLTVGYLFKDEFRKRPWCFVGVMAAISVIVGLSRIYLEVHWAADVVAGFLLGIFWFVLAVVSMNVVYHRERSRVMRD